MPRSQLIKLEKSFWALIFIITSKLHAISCLMSDNNQQDKTTEQHRSCLNMLKCTHSLLTKKKKKKSPDFTTDMRRTRCISLIFKQDHSNDRYHETSHPDTVDTDR